MMDKDEIHLYDIGRILTGDMPPAFFIEIIIRAIVVYIILMGAMRLMGKRMASRLNRNELAAISTLAAAVGIPLLTPDRGLLPGILIAFIVVLVQRLVAHYSVKSQRFERLTQGRISTLVFDSCLQLRQMEKVRISREQLFSRLRSNRIRHLGQVKRMYMEANGSFTIIRHSEKKPGLPVIPSWDKALLEEQQRAKETYVCSYCGNARKNDHDGECPNCHKHEWTHPIH